MKSVHNTGDNQNRTPTRPRKNRSLPAIETLEGRVLMSVTSVATTVDTSAVHASIEHLRSTRLAAATRLAAPSALIATQVGSGNVALQ